MVLREKSRRAYAPIKSYSWKTDLWVPPGAFTVKKTKQISKNKQTNKQTNNAKLLSEICFFKWKSIKNRISIKQKFHILTKIINLKYKLEISD